MVSLSRSLSIKENNKNAWGNFETATRIVFAVIYTAQVVALIKIGRDYLMLFMFQGATI